MKRITVPVDIEVATALERQSRENRRSTGAEAALILRDFFNSRLSTQPHKPRTRKEAVHA